MTFKAFSFEDMTIFTKTMAALKKEKWQRAQYRFDVKYGLKPHMFISLMLLLGTLTLATHSIAV